MSTEILPIIVVVVGVLVGIAGVATLFFRERFMENIAKISLDHATQTRRSSYPILLGITQIVLGVALVAGGMSSNAGMEALRGLFSGLADLPVLPGVVLALVLLLIGVGCISVAVPPLRRAREWLQAEASDRENSDSVRRPRNGVMYASVLFILGLVAIGWAFVVGIALLLAGAT